MLTVKFPCVLKKFGSIKIVSTSNHVILQTKQGGKVIIWSSDLNDSSSNALSIWKSVVLNEFNSVAWNVSWSLSTNMLAVSTGDNKVTIWKEDHYGKYICINDDKLAS